MDEALLELLDEKELPYITVKEICARAGVSRSTFYLHYETIGDLLTECTESMNRRFRDFMGESRHDFAESIPQRTRDELYLITPEYLVRYLEFVREHRQLYRTALEHAEALQLTRVYDRMYEGVITPILDRYEVGARDRRYIMAFYINGLIAVVSEWLKGDCADSVEHIAKLMQQCVPENRREQRS